MPLNAGQRGEKLMNAAEINAIKQRIKNIMAARGGNGSVTSYAGTNYNFSTNPEAGGVVKLEHGQKTVNILRNAINTTIGGRSVGPEVKDQGQAVDLATFTNANLSAICTTLENENVQGNRGKAYGNMNGNLTDYVTERSSCRTHCSGICVGNCYGRCNGCSNTCGGGCHNACNGGCGPSGCTGCSSCTGTCAGNCQGCAGCSGCCWGSCTGCNGTCNDGCGGGCNGLRAQTYYPDSRDPSSY